MKRFEKCVQFMLSLAETLPLKRAYARGTELYPDSAGANVDLRIAQSQTCIQTAKNGQQSE